MFWTLEMTHMGGSDVTLCEHHALEGTNMAMALVGDAGFGSMAEASAILGALSAVSGDDLGMTSSETGVCGECEDEAELRALHGGTMNPEVEHREGCTRYSGVWHCDPACQAARPFSADERESA